MHRADLRRSGAGERAHAALGKKASQRKGRAVVEVGFEGWIVFQTSQGKKNSTCTGMGAIKEVVHFGTCASNRAPRDKKVRA